RFEEGDKQFCLAAGRIRIPGADVIVATEDVFGVLVDDHPLVQFPTIDLLWKRLERAVIRHLLATREAVEYACLREQYDRQNQYWLTHVALRQGDEPYSKCGSADRGSRSSARTRQGRAPILP